MLSITSKNPELSLCDDAYEFMLSRAKLISKNNYSAAKYIDGSGFEGAVRELCLPLGSRQIDVLDHLMPLGRDLLVQSIGYNGVSDNKDVICDLLTRMYDADHDGVLSDCELR